MARPLLHALRAGFPDAETWVIGPSFASLFDAERLWHRRLPVEALARRDPGLLRGGRFDAALVLPPSFSSAWTMRPFPIARRVGFAGELRSWLLTDPVPRPPRGEEHLSEEYLRLGARLGAPSPPPSPALRPSEEDATLARARTKRLGIEGEPIAVLGPGAAYGPAKRWSLERWIELGRRLGARGHAVLVAGAPADRPLALAIASAVGPGARTIAGETSLGEQLALCTMARVTISNDSGLAHLAAASGAPTVVIFGSTSSAWTAPLGTRIAVVQRAPVCSPCFQRTCRIGYVCLDAVSVESVVRAYERIAA